MKTNYLRYALLLTCSVAFMQCSDDEPEKTPICYVTKLPLDDGTLLFTYNDDHQITTAKYEDDDNPDGKYSRTYEYASGKLSKVNYLYNDVVTNYRTFGHESDKIIENVFYKNGEGEFVLDTRYFHYIKNNRIVSRTTAQSSQDFVTSDSAVYTYDSQGQVITKIEYYDNKGEVQTKTEIMYDGKVSPYYISATTDGDNSYFDNTNLSTQNATKFTYSGPGWTESETFTYTYDADGKTLSRKAEWEDTAREITWACE
ncbi:hypothetical protein [Pseudochryseolinea flava]|uniref:DUF4595 domain-containing protein n=1 Tax=Pseudochryseolinea flava TaxID=2059302 RepID=A0A364Y641_9BACT|nr:hypothetical protein [Pseudochryseolinea flava]RAW02265.1 hypothetical protein DQQ10_06925 [Pseudochryseolinea flava]